MLYNAKEKIRRGFNYLFQHSLRKGRKRNHSKATLGMWMSDIIRQISKENSKWNKNRKKKKNLFPDNQNVINIPSYPLNKHVSNTFIAPGTTNVNYVMYKNKNQEKRGERLNVTFPPKKNLNVFLTYCFLPLQQISFYHSRKKKLQKRELEWQTWDPH